MFFLLIIFNKLINKCAHVLFIKTHITYFLPLLDIYFVNETFNYNIL